MVKVKTSELLGAALDWAVAQCELTRKDYRDRGLLVHRIGYGQPMPPYSTDWSQGGPIIERERIQFRSEQNTQYRAFISQFGADAVGETHLIAAMRCYVASKLGDVVDIPDELI